MKEVSIISKIVGRAVDSIRMPSAAPAASVDLSGYLLKSVWDGVWEIRETDEGTRYVLGKLPVVLQYGLTMYADGSLLDIPSIYDGLPLDNDTIYWEEIKDEEGNVIGKRIKARGGSGEGGITPTLLGDLTNVGAWANGIATEDRIMIQRKDSSSWTPLNLSEIGGGSAGFSNVLSSGDGNAFTSFILSEDKKTLTFVKGLTFAEKSDSLSGYGITDAYTKTEVDNLVGKYLSLQGGTIQGDVRLRKGSEYTSPYLYFGDSDEVFLVEETDQSLTIHANKNILLDVGGNVTLNGDEVSTKRWVETQLGDYAEKSSTLAGYGITDAKISNGVITLGGNTITPLTSHQTIYNLTLQAGTFSAATFDPNGGAKTVNIPTTTSHISEGSNLYFTNARAVSALSDTLKAYVTLSGTQTITGEKDFTGGLKVNGSPIMYDKTNKYWKLEGDLLVTGGITMYGVDGSSFGTIWDNAPIASASAKGIASFDPNFFAVNNGKVTFIGQTCGGIADSVAWDNVTGKPSWITTAKPEYQYTEIKGTPDLAGYVTLSGNQTITGEKIFESSIKIKRGFSILDDQGWGIVGVNSTGWTGLPTDGSAIGFGTGSAPVYIRTSGDDLYHYDKTKGASYKILDTLGGTMVGSIASQDIYPKTSNTYSLGTSSYLWSNFYTKKATIDGIEIKKSASGVLFLDANLVVSGAITMYGTDGTTAPTIWDGAPKATTPDTTNGKGIASFDSKFFSVSNGHVTFIGDVGGLDESALTSYLSTNKYLTQTTGDARYLAIGGNAVSASGLSGLTPIISAANESNEISAVRNNYGAITTNAPTSGAAITNALKFRWYDTDWQIGNVRNMSNGTSGFGVTYGSSNLRFLVKTDGVETYGTLKTNGVIPASNGSYSLGSSSYKWTSVYATSFEGNATSATTASKLSTTSKTAWGQTYWTSGGVPTSISGDMSNVDSIYMTGKIGINNTSPTEKLDIRNSTSDTNTFVHTVRTDKGYGISFGLGRGGVNRGIYDDNLNKWLIYADSSKTFLTQDIWINQDEWDGGLKLNRLVSGGGSGISVYSNGSKIGVFGIAGNGRFEFDTISSGSAVCRFYVDTSGNGLFYGGITMYSDLRKKTILNHVELSLKEVADAPLIEHYYNSDEAKTTHVGSVAQYWAGLNDWFCKEDGEGYLMMEIQNAALASAISVARELTRYESKTDKQIKKLKKRIGELEEEIENLKNK